MEVHRRLAVDQPIRQGFADDRSKGKAVPAETGRYHQAVWSGRRVQHGNAVRQDIDAARPPFDDLDVSLRGYGPFQPCQAGVDIGVIGG